MWVSPACAAINVYLTGVPDYGWYYGCMGTASGNLMGFWDRHGFPDFYTGSVNQGMAPLNTAGANLPVVSLWASKAGLDGRPSGSPGHVDDYYVTFDSTQPDPYMVAGREEHTPDCLGDFLGLSQFKWTNLANECNGNVDGLSFVFWETNGNKRVNFTPRSEDGQPIRDVQSGLRAWTQHRGHDCEVFTQLVDFNPTKPAGKGFTFEDMKAEIDSGYPVLLYLQSYTQYSRDTTTATHINPSIHSMLAYGYYINNGIPYVRYRSSWASGDNRLHAWNSQPWELNAPFPLRGVIGYHPLPRIRSFALRQGTLSLQWDGPAADLFDSSTGSTRRVHGYVVEMSPSLTAPAFAPVSPTLTTNRFELPNCPAPAFLRLKLVQL
jgi:hypothetical protein